MGKAVNRSRSNSLRTYRNELVGKKAELLASLGFNFKKLGDAERNSDDALIVALQDELLHSSLDRVLHEQLQDVTSALDRLAAGDYGKCANCGNSIAAKRLQAVPWATHCIDCQDGVLDGQPRESLILETLTS